MPAGAASLDDVAVKAQALMAVRSFSTTSRPAEGGRRPPSAGTHLRSDSLLGYTFPQLPGRSSVVSALLP
jgi:hypothetical protein